METPDDNPTGQIKMKGNTERQSDWADQNEGKHRMTVRMGRLK